MMLHRPLNRISPQTASRDSEKRQKHSKHTTGNGLKTLFRFLGFLHGKLPIFPREARFINLSRGDRARIAKGGQISICLSIWTPRQSVCGCAHFGYFRFRAYVAHFRLRVVSNLGDRLWGGRNTHTRAREISRRRDARGAPKFF